MKIKERIKRSSENEPLLSIGFARFLTSISTVLVIDSHQRLMIDNPDCNVCGGTIKGNAIEKPSLKDYVNVLSGGDFLRSAQQFLQLNGFISWLLDEEEPSEDSIAWNDLEFIGGKWNEYVRIKNSEVTE